MKNKMAQWMVVLIVTGLMVAGPVAYAEPQEESSFGDPGMHDAGPSEMDAKGEPRWHRRNPEEFFRGLDLSPEQKEKLKAQREGKKESIREIQKQMKTKMQALHEAISKPDSKRADVDGLLNEVNTLKGQMLAEMIDGVFAMKEVLTPEQFAKMQAKHKEFGEKKHRNLGEKIRKKKPWKMEKD